MRIGVLGGTFDPPHYGHLLLAELACEQLSLDHVLWAPAADPPHKQGRVTTPVEDRLEMLRLALAGNERFELSLVDVERPGPQYTVDTLALLAERYVDAAFHFLLGGDSLQELPTWHEPNRLIRQARLAVMLRPGEKSDLGKLEAVLPGLRDRLDFVTSPLVAISSVEIRERVMQGATIRYMLPEDVREYALKQALYRPSREGYA